MSLSRGQYNIFQQLTSVRVSAAANLAGSYLNGPLNNGVNASLTANAVGALVVDGVTLSVGDRLLLAAQTNANENGVYVVSQAGGASALWVIVRSADQQSIEQYKAGQFLSVNAGTANAGALYVTVEPLPAALGISNLVFVNSSALGSSAFLAKASNLSDLASPLAARANLGLGSAAVAAAASFQLAASIRAQKAAFAGGAATAVLPDASLSAASVIVACIESSANAVQIQKVTPGAGNVTVLFSADPGASVISYIALSAAQ